MDVALFRDGSLDKSQVELLKAVRKALNEPQTAAAPVPPGNLAWRKQSRLLSLYGAKTLGPSCETQFARLGARLAHRMSPRRLKQAFALLMLLVGAKFMLFS